MKHITLIPSYTGFRNLRNMLHKSAYLETYETHHSYTLLYRFSESQEHAAAGAAAPAGDSFSFFLFPISFFASPAAPAGDSFSIFFFQFIIYIYMDIYIYGYIYIYVCVCVCVCVFSY
jgi:hypothetical protein